MKKFITHSFILLCSAVCMLALFTSGAKSQWVQTNGPFGANVWSVALSGTNLFAGTAGAGVFFSTNEGGNWTAANIGLVGTNVFALTVNGSTLYAGTDKGIGVSTDNGATWKSSLTSKTVQAVLINGNTTIIGTSFGLLRTTDGITWKSASTGLTNLNVVTLAILGSTLFAGTPDGIFSSTNNGTVWTQLAPPNTNRLVAAGTNLFAATNGGAFLSTDNGSSWTALNYGDMTDNTVVWDLAMMGSSLFAATDANGVLVSTDNGSNWTTVNNGLSTLAVSTVKVNGTKLIAGTSKGVAISTNNGTSWTEYNSGLAGVSGHAFAVKGNDLYAATLDHLFRTSDNGRNWVPLTDDGGTYSFMNALIYHGNNLFVADAGNGVFRSSDNGVSWVDVSNGLGTNKVWCLGEMGDALFVGGYVNYSYRSMDNGASWDGASAGLSGNGVSCYATIGENLFTETGNGGSFGPSGVFISNDTGNTWTSVSEGLPYSNYGFSLAVIGNKLYASAKGGGVFVSADNGTSWSDVTNGLSKGVGLIFAYGTNLLATTDMGIFLTKDGGTNWINANAGLPTTSYNTWSMVKSSSDILVGNDFGFWRRPIAEFEILAVKPSSDQATLQINISPNPTNGIVTVHSAEESNVHVTIANILGQRVIELTHLLTSEFQIDLSNFPSGAYVAKFESAGSVITKIIVKD